MNLEMIPLSKLVPAACNVRKTGAVSIDDLAASIVSHGLLQNLQVRALPSDGVKAEWNFPRCTE
ncbi:MAG: ParB N-terminal domain-containing protein [Geminicoccaceae bacterium]